MSGNLNVKDWGEWDSSYDRHWEGPQICVPSNSRMVGSIHFEHPGDALCNVRLSYVDLAPDSQLEYSNDLGQTDLGAMTPTEKNCPYEGRQDFHIIGVNTRIWYGRGMSDYQLIYRHKKNGVWIEGANEWHRSDFNYNLQFAHRAADGWEVDGMQLAVFHGDSIIAMKVHTRERTSQNSK